MAERSFVGAGMDSDALAGGSVWLSTGVGVALIVAMVTSVVSEAGVPCTPTLLLVGVAVIICGFGGPGGGGILICENGLASQL